MAATDKRKPPAAGMGRRKGSTNKVTGEVKAMVLAALDGVGGVEYLMERANDPRTSAAFMSLVSKVMPMQVVGDPDNPVQHAIRVEFVKAK